MTRICLRYELDEISFEIIHVVAEISTRLSSGVANPQLVFTRYEVYERRVTEICDARSL